MVCILKLPIIHVTLYEPKTMYIYPDNALGHYRMRWLDSVTDSVNMNLSKLHEIVKDKRAWCAVVHGAAKSWVRFSDCTTSSTNIYVIVFVFYFILYFNLKALLILIHSANMHSYFLEDLLF